MDYANPFEVLIEGVGNIALDDTIFTPECQWNSSIDLPLMVNGTCSRLGQWSCRSSNVCIDQDEVCDFVVHCPDGSDEVRDS